MLIRAVMPQSKQQGSEKQRFYCNRRDGWYELRDFHNGDKSTPKRIPAERLDIAAELFGRRPVQPYYVDMKGYSQVLHAKSANTNEMTPTSVSSIFRINYIGGGCAGNGCNV